MAAPAEPGPPVDPEAGSLIPRTARASSMRVQSLGRVTSARGRQLKDSPRLRLNSPRPKVPPSPRPMLKDRDAIEALRADVALLQNQVKTLKHALETTRSDQAELQNEKNKAENAWSQEYEARLDVEKSLRQMTDQCRHDQTRAVRAEDEFKVVVHGLRQEITLLKQEGDKLFHNANAQAAQHQKDKEQMAILLNEADARVRVAQESSSRNEVTLALSLIHI